MQTKKEKDLNALFNVTASVSYSPCQENTDSCVVSFRDKEIQAWHIYQIK